MTVVLVHFFKLLSFFPFIVTLSHLRYCDSAFQNLIRFNFLLVYTVLTGMVELLRVGICGRWCTVCTLPAAE